MNEDLLAGFSALKSVLRQTFTRGYIPRIFAIGLTNVCNLSCPLCITGLKRQQKSKQFMTYELFTSIIDKIREFHGLVQLYKWGESLLHKDFINILEYCNVYDLNTEISSNLSLPNIDEKLEAMVRFRLKHLIVSFDGINQEDYSRYRIGGDFNLVLWNLNKLSDYKKAYNSVYPVISLQYLRNKYTTNQIKVIAENYTKWGADRYYSCDMTTVFKDRDTARAFQWFSEEEIARRKYLDVNFSMLGKRCPFLYDYLIVEQDGSIPPCCWCTDPADDFFQWDNTMTIQQMYNTDKFKRARRMFQDRKAEETLVCNDCSIFLTYRMQKNK
ncbi:radical SAM/SPASM domain-containing protein [Syntrophus buswellii]|jgi:MoaA/NifB/PqqE/SkfB family radical SAM enzyme|uniref:radical SAM protein n=1 Tax=Syntrophus TaxID=43773 RepID=UPI002A4D0FDF|nr:radical SAM protein [Syntrophus sp. (in: bacteria)]